MNKNSIINLDVKVCTWKSELPQQNFLRSLKPPKTTRQRPFGLTCIKYDKVKDEISDMECV